MSLIFSRERKCVSFLNSLMAPFRERNQKKRRERERKGGVRREREKEQEEREREKEQEEREREINLSAAHRIFLYSPFSPSSLCISVSASHL